MKEINTGDLDNDPTSWPSWTSPRQGKSQLMAAHRAGRINTTSQARSFTYSCIQIPRSKFFGSSLSTGTKKKKGAVTHAHTLQELRFVLKAKFLFSAYSRFQKKLLEIRPPKNPHWAECSARSKHLHSLQIHPPCVQWEPRWSAKSWFLPMKTQARLPAELHYRERGAIPLDSVNGFQTMARCDRDESLTSCTCAAGGWEIYWVKSWLC